MEDKSYKNRVNKTGVDTRKTNKVKFTEDFSYSKNMQRKDFITFNNKKYYIDSPTNDNVENLLSLMELQIKEMGEVVKTLKNILCK